MLTCDYCAYLSLYGYMPVCVFLYMSVSTRYMQSDLPTPIYKPLPSCCQAFRTAAVTMETMYPEDCLPYLYVSFVGVCARAWVSSVLAFTTDLW